MWGIDQISINDRSGRGSEMVRISDGSHYSCAFLRPLCKPYVRPSTTRAAGDVNWMLLRLLVF
jgi:hypothetical protein